MASAVSPLLLLLPLLQLLPPSSGSLHASKALPQGRPSLNWDKYLLQPTFDESNRRKVIAAAGSTAFLHCKINHLADRAVTWIRKADVQVLTVNSYTYTMDPRFTAHSSTDADEWVLKITSARIHDSGGYECQVSTETKMSLTFELHVVVAYAEISGTKEVYMNSGGDLDLSCTVGRITDPPEFVLWYHANTIINYSDRTGVTVSMSRARKTSRLLIRNVEAADSGNYTCVPSNARPASVTVHIVKEERPAAMQHGDTGSCLRDSLTLVLSVTGLLAVLQTLIISDDHHAGHHGHDNDGTTACLDHKVTSVVEDVTLPRRTEQSDLHLCSRHNCRRSRLRREETNKVNDP